MNFKVTEFGAWQKAFGNQYGIKVDEIPHYRKQCRIISKGCIGLYEGFYFYNSHDSGEW